MLDLYETIEDMIAQIVPKSYLWKLDKEIDFESESSDGQLVPKHQGKIAQSMLDWEMRIADHMDFTESERRDITEGNKCHPDLQRYIAY